MKNLFSIVLVYFLGVLCIVSIAKRANEIDNMESLAQNNYNVSENVNN